MLSREKGGEKSKKGVFFLFFMPPFLLDCVFLLTKIKRQNDKNVLLGACLGGNRNRVKRIVWKNTDSDITGNLPFLFLIIWHLFCKFVVWYKQKIELCQYKRDFTDISQ